MLGFYIEATETVVKTIVYYFKCSVWRSFCLKTKRSVFLFFITKKYFKKSSWKNLKRLLNFKLKIMNIFQVLFTYNHRFFQLVNSTFNDKIDDCKV